MKTNKLSELTIEELNKQSKLLKGVLIGLAIVLLAAYSVLICLMINNKDFTLGTVIPAGFIALMPAAIKLSQIKAEIKLRNSKEE